MKASCLLTFCLFLFASCSEKKSALTASSNLDDQLRNLSEGLTKSELNGDLNTFLAFYDENAISMPEYQPTLEGANDIESYFTEIFKRQKVKSLQRKTEEVINLDSTIIEIGTLKKEYSESNTDSITVLNGKYWNIWRVDQDGNFKLKGEAFGYFHPVQNPASFVVHLARKSNESRQPLSKEIPFELRAYNALMEKGVRDRNGDLRARFFTDDGMFMPFQEPTVKGMEKIKPYLVAYSNQGQVKIDSIEVYPYHFEYFDDYVLEYPKFYVKWKAGEFTGQTEGKGIRIWKRQNDKSLRIFREIGTHNHLL